LGDGQVLGTMVVFVTLWYLAAQISRARGEVRFTENDLRA